MEWNERTYSWTSDRPRLARRLAYRFTAPAPAFFNRFQRVIWRVQRLTLGDNHDAKLRRARRRAARR